MRPAHRRFALSGVNFELRSRSAGDLDGLSASYGAYEAGEAAAADVVVEIERAAGFCEGRERGPRYPAFETSVTGGTLRLERFDADGEVELASSPLRGRFRVGPSPHSLEAVIRIAASIALPRRGALILHASCVADRRGAHLFAGVSGAGKSTIAALLADACGDAVELVSEELVILAPDGGGWRAHVAPFLAKVELPHGLSRPLASINFLEQAPAHERSELQRATALRELLRHILVYARDPITSDAVLGSAAALLAAVPAFRLRFAPRGDVAEVLGIT